LTINSNASNAIFALNLTGTVVATAPNAPTINFATPWDGQVTVDFTPAIFDGGSPVRYYTVSATTPGPYFPFVQSGSGSPIIVTGMGNGTTYTFTVTATNDFGTSPPSIAKDAMPYFAPIRIGTTGYGELQSALSDVTANGTITAQNLTVFVATPPTTISKGVTLSGGHNTDYTAVTGFTTIPGRVNIMGSGFKVIFNNIKVKAP
jgi:hypothetical protein